MTKKVKQRFVGVDYQLDFDPDSLGNECLAHCCGVQEIGGFDDPQGLLDLLQEQRESALEDAQDFDENNNEVKLPPDLKAPPEPTLQDVIKLTEDYIAAQMTEFKGAFIATTVASQTHAHQALRNLRFTPTKVTSRVTLWVKKASGVRG